MVRRASGLVPRLSFQCADSASDHKKGLQCRPTTSAYFVKRQLSGMRVVMDEIADVVLAYLSFLWLCRPAAACCSDEPPRVLEPELVPTFALPDFLWLWLPAAACCCDVPPRVPDPALLLPDVPEDLLSFLPI
jgi:hypothetical protein